MEVEDPDEKLERIKKRHRVFENHYDQQFFYDFFKTPDGEDCLEKTYYYTKYSAISGLIFSFYETCLFSKPSTFYGTIGRFGRFTLPFAAMGMVMGSSVCILGQVRKKNDVFNHVVSGILAGSVWGFKYNSMYIAHRWGIFFGFVAGYYKFFHVEGIPMFQRAPECYRQDRQGLNFGVKLFDDPGRPDEA